MGHMMETPLRIKTKNEKRNTTIPPLLSFTTLKIIAIILYKYIGG